MPNDANTNYHFRLADQNLHAAFQCLFAAQHAQARGEKVAVFKLVAAAALHFGHFTAHHGWIDETLRKQFDQRLGDFRDLMLASVDIESTRSIDSLAGLAPEHERELATLRKHSSEQRRALTAARECGAAARQLLEWGNRIGGIQANAEALRMMGEPVDTRVVQKLKRAYWNRVQRYIAQCLKRHAPHSTTAAAR